MKFLVHMIILFGHVNIQLYLHDCVLLDPFGSSLNCSVWMLGLSHLPPLPHFPPLFHTVLPLGSALFSMAWSLATCYLWGYCCELLMLFPEMPPFHLTNSLDLQHKSLLWHIYWVQPIQTLFLLSSNSSQISPFSHPVRGLPSELLGLAAVLQCTRNAVRNWFAWGHLSSPLDSSLLENRDHVIFYHGYLVLHTIKYCSSESVV